MKKILKNPLCIALCGAFLLSGCAKKNDPSPSEISVIGDESGSSSNAFPAMSCGVKLEKAPEKIVSLSPAATEIVCELGFKDKLVGVSDYCDYPEGLSAPKVGSTENPDIDAIVKLKPDAVFTLSALSERETYTLNQSNIAVLTAEPPQNMEGYSALYREIAAAFYGRETIDSEKDTAKAVQIGADARSAIEKAAKDVQLESFVYVTGKLTVAGADTFESAVLSLSGTNVCKEAGYVSPDGIGGAPKYIIADSALTESDLAADGTLNGYINGGAQIRFVNAVSFERPTARTAEVFKEISKNAASSVDEQTAQ